MRDSDSIAAWRGPRSIRSEKVELRTTPARGTAIYAKEPIFQGEMVFIKGGHLVPTSIAQWVDRTIGDFSMQVSDDLFLVPLSEAEVSDVVVYFNHSCSPNIVPDGQIEFVALRYIAAGEELCTDYAMTIDTSNRAPYKLDCSCGATTCRVKITGLDWMKPELQQRYSPHFSPFIMRKIRALQKPS